MVDMAKAIIFSLMALTPLSAKIYQGAEPPSCKRAVNLIEKSK